MKKISDSEKAAHVTGRYSTRNQIIAGLFILLAPFLTWVLTRGNRNESKANQTIKAQKLDTGSINNYNARGDIKIENNTYSTAPIDSMKSIKNNNSNKKILVYKESPHKKVDTQLLQAKNQIINNAPNQGLQINENYGPILVDKPLPRKVTVEQIKQILLRNINNLPLGVEVEGNKEETINTGKQVVNILNKLGYSNLKIAVGGKIYLPETPENGIVGLISDDIFFITILSL